MTVSHTLENFVPKFLVGGQVVEIKRRKMKQLKQEIDVCMKMAQVHIRVLIQLIQEDSIQLL